MCLIYLSGVHNLTKCHLWYLFLSRGFRDEHARITHRHEARDVAGELLIHSYLHLSGPSYTEADPLGNPLRLVGQHYRVIVPPALLTCDLSHLVIVH